MRIYPGKSLTGLSLLLVCFRNPLEEFETEIHWGLPKSASATHMQFHLVSAPQDLSTPQGLYFCSVFGPDYFLKPVPEHLCQISRQKEGNRSEVFYTFAY